MRHLHLILGDQLSMSLSSLEGYDPARDMILMCEVHAEATYVKHHKKKIAFIFSAMRHFARALQAKGFNVTYRKYDDAENSGTFQGEVQRLVSRYPFQRLIVTEPGEYRLLEEMQGWQKKFNLVVELREITAFYVGGRNFTGPREEKTCVWNILSVNAQKISDFDGP